jgi:hypothetical protein
LETISIELADEMTLGQLRELARGMRKRLVISFESGGRVGRPKRGAQVQGEAPAPQRTKRRRRRRKLSPEARAALAQNLVKARAARSAKAESKAKSPKRARKAATTPA